MAIDFPASPSTNQQYVYNGVTYVYTSQGMWVASTTPVPAAPFDAMAYNGLQINGSMDVSQEFGTTLQTITNSSKYVVDGFGALFAGTSASASCGQIAISTLVGFSNALIMQCTVANALGSSLDGSFFYQNIEGYRWARLGFGTASAQPVTIGFWINPNISGTMAVSVRGGGNRAYVVDVPVTAAVWQFKTVTIPGDVAGTWNTTNGTGATICFCFGAGAGRKIAANTWTASVPDGVATSATTNFFAATGTSYITGVVVLPGSDAPSAARAPFIMRPYDQELTICKRYLWRQNMPTAPTNISTLQAYSASLAGGACFGLYPAMRSAPSVTISNILHFGCYSAAGTVNSATTLNFGSSLDAVWLNTSTFPAVLVGGNAATFIANNAAAWVQMDARL